MNRWILIFAISAVLVGAAFLLGPAIFAECNFPQNEVFTTTMSSGAPVTYTAMPTGCPQASISLGSPSLFFLGIFLVLVGLSLLLNPMVLAIRKKVHRRSLPSNDAQYHSSDADLNLQFNSHSPHLLLLFTSKRAA